MTYQSCRRDALSMYTVIETFPISPLSRFPTIQEIETAHGLQIRTARMACLLLTVLYWASHHHFILHLFCFFFFLANISMVVRSAPSLRCHKKKKKKKKPFSRRGTLMRKNSRCELSSILTIISLLVIHPPSYSLFSRNFTFHKLWFPLAFLQLSKKFY